MAPAAFFQRSKKTVCVMDASGRIGSALVKRLLQRGYTVHAAVQAHGDVQLRRRLNGDSKKLKIFEVDTLDYHSIVEALKDCSGLFYTFEPPKDQTSYDELMVEEEVRAAHNVLEACAQTDTIDKVIFTSSATAVFWRDQSQSESSSLEIDERHWTDLNFCRKFKLWYALAKTLAEKTAWALSMDRGLDMVSVNAGLLTCPEDLSIENPYLKGAAQMYEDGVLVTVDLDFLVDAHINAFEDISSYGRYLCFNRVINHPDDAFHLASKLTPSPPSHSQSYEHGMGTIEQRLSNKKLKKLMLDFVAKSQMDDLDIELCRS